MTRFLTKKNAVALPPLATIVKAFFTNGNPVQQKQKNTLFFLSIQQHQWKGHRVILYAHAAQPAAPHKALSTIRLLCVYYYVIWVFNTGLSLDSVNFTITVILNNSTFRPQCSFLFWAPIAVFCVLCAPPNFAVHPQVTLICNWRLQCWYGINSI